MRLQLLHQHVGRNFEDDVGDEEDGKGSIIFGSGLDIQVGFETQNGRVTDIDAAQLMSFTPFGVERPVHWESCIPIQKCKQIHDAKTRHHMPVNLGHQLALVDGGVLRRCWRGLAIVSHWLFLCNPSQSNLGESSADQVSAKNNSGRGWTYRQPSFSIARSQERSQNTRTTEKDERKAESEKIQT